MSIKDKEIISPLFRVDFREFCVSYLVLRQINDCFSSSGIRKGQLPSDRPVSGQRRALVEEYYSTLEWGKSEDADKFLQVVQFVYAQSYSSDEPRKTLQAVLEREGYAIEKLQIRRRTAFSAAQNLMEVDETLLRELHDKLIALAALEPQQRGYAFEQFLSELFATHGLAPRNSFRLTGEQIDGSFQIGADVYLVEAKWQSKQTSHDDLLIFREKVESKSTWTRGLFVSYAGFTKEGLTAFARGRATNIIGMDGQDLYYALTGKISLTDAILKKVRRAAETGEFFTSVFDLLHG